MGETMFMSLDTNAGTETTTSFSTASESADRKADASRWYLRGRWLLAIWAVLSIGWGGAVGYDLFQRVSMQADMSRDVEAELDQGFVPTSCVGSQCRAAAARASKTQSWSGIAATYLKFGSDEMAEFTLGPPAALLLIGLGAMFIGRRRSGSTRRARF
jgi:hypothetical protein